MPVTVRQGFEGLRSSLEITGLQASTVSNRQRNVRSNISAELSVLDDFVVGSHQRNTMIAPLSDADVDIFVVLHSDYFSQDRTGPANLLDRVKRALRKHYTESTDISRNGQAVTIKFADFRIDVVPGFKRDGGGYLIPDSVSQRWISTDPKKHIEHWSSRNSSQSGKLIPLIKMIKGWNRSHSEKFRSFHLEALVLQVFQFNAIGEYWLAARDFFQNAQNQFQSVYDPAGYGGNLADYMDSTRRQEAMERLKAAYDKAADAVNLDAVGRTGEAFGKWRVVFGAYFPAYG